MALDSLTHIQIDVANPSVTPVVRAVQEDIRSRYIEIELLENREALTIPGTATGAVGVRTPNNLHILYDEDEDSNAAVTISGNVATVYLRQEALAVPGRAYCNLILKDGSTILTSFAFLVDVEAVAVPSGVVVQSDYINVWQAEIDQAAQVVSTATGIVQDCTDEADRAKGEADRAQSYASGVQYPVSYAAQTLTSSEQAQARANISAASNAHASTHATGGSDALAPADIGAALASDLANYIPLSQKAAASGVASLDSSSHVTASQAAAAYMSKSANYTVAAGDAGKVILCTGTITITLGSLSQGVELEIWNKGTGIVTISGTLFVAGYGSLSSCKISSYSVVVCKRMNSVWHIAGGATT